MLLPDLFQGALTALLLISAVTGCPCSDPCTKPPSFSLSQCFCFKLVCHIHQSPLPDHDEGQDLHSILLQCCLVTFSFWEMGTEQQREEPCRKGGWQAGVHSLSAEGKIWPFHSGIPCLRPWSLKWCLVALHRGDCDRAVLLQSVFCCCSLLGDAANTPPW